MDTPPSSPSSASSHSLPSPASVPSPLPPEEALMDEAQEETIEEEEQERYTFSPPIPDADLIILTTDNVELHAHTLILRRVSPILAAAIDASLSTTAAGNGKAQIHLPATGRILDLLLRHLYPEYDPPESENLDDLLSLLSLAATYQLGPLLARLRKELVTDRFLYSNPIKTYAALSSLSSLPSRSSLPATSSASSASAPSSPDLSLEPELALALEATTLHPLPTLTPLHLQGLSAISYLRLQRYHRQRTISLTRALDRWLGRRCKDCQSSNSWAAQFHARAVREVQSRPSVRVILGEEFAGRGGGRAGGAGAGGVGGAGAGAGAAGGGGGGDGIAGVCGRCDVYWAFLEGWRELGEACSPQAAERGEVEFFVPRPPARPNPPEPVVQDEQLAKFDEGDVVLRTSDGVDLQAWKLILTQASPFFADLLSLPQHPAPTSPSPTPSFSSSSSSAIPSSEEKKDEKPIISFPEPSTTLRPLLQLLSPLPNPAFPTNLSTLEPLLEAAHKYDIPLALSHISSLLTQPRFLQQDPVRAYALACVYGLKEVGRRAARASLRVDMENVAEVSVAGLSAVQYTRLLAWRQQTSSALQALITDRLGIYTCFACGERWPARWAQLAKQELERRPWSGKIFELDFLSRGMGPPWSGMETNGDLPQGSYYTLREMPHPLLGSFVPPHYRQAAASGQLQRELREGAEAKSGGCTRTWLEQDVRWFKEVRLRLREYERRTAGRVGIAEVGWEEGDSTEAWLGNDGQGELDSDEELWREWMTGDVVPGGQSWWPL